MKMNTEQFNYLRNKIEAIIDAYGACSSYEQLQLCVDEIMEQIELEQLFEQVK